MRSSTRISAVQAKSDGSGLDSWDGDNSHSEGEMDTHASNVALGRDSAGCMFDPTVFTASSSGKSRRSGSFAITVAPRTSVSPVSS